MAGSKSATRMPMIAMTTSSSTNVKAGLFRREELACIWEFSALGAGIPRVKALEYSISV
jgi:hypothetical protein